MDSSSPTRCPEQRVFVSYSHDSAEHCARVLALADRLRSEGVGAWLDRYDEAPAEGWPTWMQKQLVDADFVVLVCTDTYRLRFENRDPAGGRGATWEGLLATQLLYESDAFGKKVVPVLYAPSGEECIPVGLRPFTHYRLPDGYEKLYRRLTRQPEVVAPPLGQLVAMPPRRAVATPLPTQSTVSVGLPDNGAGVRGKAEFLTRLAREEQQSGRHLAAVRAFTEARELFRVLGDRGEEASILCLLGCAERKLDRPERARAAFAEASAMTTKDWQRAWVLREVGEFEQSLGNDDAAFAAYKDSYLAEPNIAARGAYFRALGTKDLMRVLLKLVNLSKTRAPQDIPGYFEKMATLCEAMGKAGGWPEAAATYRAKARLAVSQSTDDPSKTSS